MLPLLEQALYNFRISTIRAFIGSVNTAALQGMYPAFPVTRGIRQHPKARKQFGVKYAIRLPANENLEREIEELVTRPIGRPSHRPVVRYKGFLY